MLVSAGRGGEIDPGSGGRISVGMLKLGYEVFSGGSAFSRGVCVFPLSIIEDLKK